MAEDLAEAEGGALGPGSGAGAAMVPAMQRERARSKGGEKTNRKHRRKEKKNELQYKHTRGSNEVMQPIPGAGTDRHMIDASAHENARHVKRHCRGNRETESCASCSRNNVETSIAHVERESAVSLIPKASDPCFHR